MTSWFRNLWSGQSPVHARGVSGRMRRIPRCGYATEELELRTLLSGRGLGSAAIAAEVAPHHAKASFTPPDIAGEWTVTAAGGQGTITFTQEGVNVSYTDGGDPSSNIPPISGTTKFKAKHINAIVDKIKAQTDVGTVKVRLVITFAPNQSEPQTFTGQFIIKKTAIQISGVRVHN